MFWRKPKTVINLSSAPLAFSMSSFRSVKAIIKPVILIKLFNLVSCVNKLCAPLASGGSGAAGVGRVSGRIWEGAGAGTGALRPVMIAGALAAARTAPI